MSKPWQQQDPGLGIYLWNTVSTHSTIVGAGFLSRADEPKNDLGIAPRYTLRFSLRACPVCTLACIDELKLHSECC